MEMISNSQRGPARTESWNKEIPEGMLYTFGVIRPKKCLWCLGDYFTVRSA